MLEQFYAVFDAADLDPEPFTTEKVVNMITDLINELFDLYKPVYSITTEAINAVLEDIGTMPDDVWNMDNPPEDFIEWFTSDLQSLIVTITNSLFVNFKIDPFDGREIEDDADIVDLQYTIFNEVSARFDLVVCSFSLSCSICIIFLFHTHPKKHF